MNLEIIDEYQYIFLGFKILSNHAISSKYLTIFRPSISFIIFISRCVYIINRRINFPTSKEHILLKLMAEYII